MIPFMEKTYRNWYCKGCHRICHDCKSALEHQHEHALTRLVEVNQ